MVLIIFIAYAIVISLMCAYAFVELKGAKQNLGKLSSMVMPLTPELRKSDLTLVFDAMDRAIIRTLFDYANRDHNFSESSPIKSCLKGHYRDLITCLLRPDIFYDDTEISTDGKVSMFETFVIKVYYLYISETSSAIKDLFFKYYSGYSIEEYQMKKKGIPSVQSFLVEYTRNYIWCRFEENSEAEHELLSSAGDSSDNYIKMINDYDSDCIRKLSLNIYHINDLEPKVLEPNTKEVTK